MSIKKMKPKLINDVYFNLNVDISAHVLTESE